MGHSRDETRQKGAWTPFVGVALAALTAGSLVLFSLVAQRTSLEGFSTRGITAIAPSAATPRSITLPGGGTAAAPGGAVASSPTDATATSLLTLSPTSAVGSGDTTPAPLVSPTSGGGADIAAAPNRTLDPTRAFSASFSDGGDRVTLLRDGQTRAASQDRGEADEGKAKKAKKAKKDRDRTEARGHGRGGRATGPNGHSRSRAVGRASKSHSGRSRSTSSSRPAHASRPTPRPKPQKASKPKSSSGHSNTTGKGHTKGRGRGHAND